MTDETGITTEEEESTIMIEMIEAPETTEMIEMKIVSNSPTAIIMQALATTMAEPMRTSQLSSDSQR